MGEDWGWPRRQARVRESGGTGAWALRVLMAAPVWHVATAIAESARGVATPTPPSDRVRGVTREAFAAFLCRYYRAPRRHGLP